MHVEEARQVLDRFAVAERLQHIRRFVWRGGSLRFIADAACVEYELTVRREVKLLEPAFASRAGLERTSTPVVEGRWASRLQTVALRVGIDLSAPSAIFVRCARLQSLVPYAGRAAAQVEHALQTELVACVERGSRQLPSE